MLQAITFYDTGGRVMLSFPNQVARPKQQSYCTALQRKVLSYCHNQKTEKRSLLGRQFCDAIYSRVLIKVCFRTKVIENWPRAPPGFNKVFRVFELWTRKQNSYALV